MSKGQDSQETQEDSKIIIFPETAPAWTDRGYTVQNEKKKKKKSLDSPKFYQQETGLEK